MTPSDIFSGLQAGTINQANFGSAVYAAGGRDVVMLEAIRRLSNSTTSSASFAALTGAPADNAALSAALAGKAASAHTHAIADTVGLQAALDGRLTLAAQTLTLAERTRALANLGITIAADGLVTLPTGHSFYANQP